MLNITDLNEVYIEALSDSELLKKSLSARLDEFLSNLATDDLLSLDAVSLAAERIMGALSSKSGAAEYLAKISSAKSDSYKILYVLIYAYQIEKFSQAVQQYSVNAEDILIYIMMMVNSDDKFSSIVY